MKNNMTGCLQASICNVLKDYRSERPIDQVNTSNEPDKKIITGITDQLFGVIYPGYFKDRSFHYYAVSSSVTVLLEDIAYQLGRQICKALRNDLVRQRIDADPSLVGKEEDQLITPEEIAALERKADHITVEFINRIPKVREYLDTDLEAFFDGDPAAESRDEIILCYPGFYAITVFRMAHELYDLEVPVVPRIMTEYAHTQTGIDINPGATIGKYFFIDHGTGIVIGETTKIGEHVKVYQGVTLGALSTRGGRKLQNKKRHPTIEDNVTIYSGASILGGETVIGKNSIIGGNVFITSPVAEDTRVSVKNQELRFDSDRQVLTEVETPDSDVWYYVI